MTQTSTPMVPPDIAAATSRSTRLHSPGADISPAELQLAARNHGMPLEMLRQDLTPAGLHYLLIHYDIPLVDAAQWRLSVDGLVDRPMSLDISALRERPRRTVRVTMECAGNGRVLLDPLDRLAHRDRRGGIDRVQALRPVEGHDGHGAVDGEVDAQEPTLSGSSARSSALSGRTSTLKM